MGVQDSGFGISETSGEPTPSPAACNKSQNSNRELRPPRQKKRAPSPCPPSALQPALRSHMATQRNERWLDTQTGNVALFDATVSHTHTLFPTHSLTHTFTLSPSLSHTYSLAHTHTHADRQRGALRRDGGQALRARHRRRALRRAQLRHSHTHTLTYSHTHTLTHSHTHTLTHSHTHTLTHSHTHTHSLTHTHTLTLTLTHLHTHTHSLTHTHSHTHTLTHSHTHTHSHTRRALRRAQLRRVDPAP